MRPYMRFVWGVVALMVIMAIGPDGHKIIGGDKATWIQSWRACVHHIHRLCRHRHFNLSAIHFYCVPARRQKQRSTLEKPDEKKHP